MTIQIIVFFRKFGFISAEMEIPYEKQEDYIFYIINDRESETPHQNSFSYHCEITTNKKQLLFIIILALININIIKKT